ncbi:helix-turn-helix domain-containing protein [Aliiruegeria sabulilitoris]|uniref:helix-turn-helix domain-containing protein n=1 Tax=Aliiruegeria sabulilitoris TaxID=1510458 RepID=UPI00082C0C74|nr:AraC family transcriptional regulator [Aliiruegeria sabulilitoris]
MTTVAGWGPLPELVREMSGERTLRRVLEAAGIPVGVLDAPQQRIPIARMVQLFEGATRAVGEETFGLRVGRGTQLADYGDWAGYCAGARTLADGLERVCKAIWVHEAGSRMWIAPEEDHVVWRYSTELRADLRGRAFSDHLLKPMLDFPRAFLGPDWEPDWIELDYALPRSTSLHDELASCAFCFERPAVGVPVRRADLAARTRLPDILPRPVTSLDLKKYRPRRKDGPLEHMVEIIDLCLLDGTTELENVAQLLDLGPRTLQRQLSRHGTQYRTLLEEARRRRAKALLLETSRPIKAIAADLGYQEAQNFTRAFGAWYGTSPKAFRAAYRRAFD